MPFIKFTVPYQTPNGTVNRLRFVNVDEVTVADYDEEKETLLLLMKKGPGYEEKFEITGEEAKEGLKKLQSL